MASTTPCVLDALSRFPHRFRGVAITDTRIAPATLREWHELGMRGLRFHLFPPAESPTMCAASASTCSRCSARPCAELGWVMQVFCDWRLMGEVARLLREIAREMPVVLDHMLNMPAARGIDDPVSRRCCGWSARASCTSSCRRPIGCRTRYPDYADAQPFHDALLAPIRSGCCGAPTGRIPRLPPRSCRTTAISWICFITWTPNEGMRRRILVETPARLFEN